MNSITDRLLLFLKGMAMGAADVVPGVSGGTIAFITGIYETLLNSIKSIQPGVLKTLKDDGLAAAWQQINGSFLLTLFAGIAVSILSLAKIIEHLLTSYPVLLWAFFFGLIIASAIYIGRQLSHWDTKSIITLVAGVIIAYLITIANPTQAPDSLPFVFFAGCIAICAMILPGISGSFILLLLGMYSTILGAVNDRDIVTLGIFMMGCGIGLLSFSHVLSWLFKSYRNLTLAFLTGLMIGSLNKVWPWKETISTRVNSHGETEPFLQQNVSPFHYTSITGDESYLLGAIALLFAGFTLVFLLERLGGNKPAI